MSGWTVTQTFNTEADASQMQRLLIALADYRGHVSTSPGQWSVSVSLDEDTDVFGACTIARNLVRDAAAEFDLEAFPATRISARSSTGEGTPNPDHGYEELLGLAELADLLGVTKQRASVIRSQPTFPRPLQELKSGPVWPRSWLDQWLGTWDRKPGRPRADRRTGSFVPNYVRGEHDGDVATGNVYQSASFARHDRDAFTTASAFEGDVYQDSPAPSRSPGFRDAFRSEAPTDAGTGGFAFASPPNFGDLFMADPTAAKSEPDDQGERAGGYTAR